MTADTDLRDRLIAVERDVLNQQRTFSDFKTGDFGDLKKEVHTMRGEFNDKLDGLAEKLDTMRGEFNDKRDGLAEKLDTLNGKILVWTGAIGIVAFCAPYLLKLLVH